MADWRALPHCPGRSIWTGADDLRPSDLAGPDARVRVFRVSAAPDPVHVVAYDDGGGLISYEKASGRFVHTLNTAEGFARKLAQLGIRLEST